MDNWNQVAQGDLLLTRIDALPPGLTEVPPTGRVHIVAHSETGHHHVVDAHAGVRYFRSPDPLISYLEVADASTTLRHLREHDTHRPHGLRPGKYELRRQREYTPAGWRMVVD